MAGFTNPQASTGQASTQNPQTVPSGQTISGGAAQSSGVQPVAPQNLSTSDQAGVSLGATQLTTVSLNPSGAPAASSTSTQAAAKPAHHINAGLLAASAVLIVIAVCLFWVMTRSAKNTTY